MVEASEIQREDYWLIRYRERLWFRARASAGGTCEITGRTFSAGDVVYAPLRSPDPARLLAAYVDTAAPMIEAEGATT